MDLDKVKKLKIPKAPGCYQFIDKKGKIIYIGKAADLRSRVLSYWRKSSSHTPAKRAMLEQISQVKWIETDSEIEALLLEANLIKKYKPEFNILLRDDKRFIYIKISTEDVIPGVFVTRKIERRGKYFGPFTSVVAVRETLKAIRKIWPYCTEKKLKKKVCFYSQIGRCTGVSGGEIRVVDYKTKVIKPIEMFLGGRKGRIISNVELRIANLEKKGEKYIDEISLLKSQLRNMKYVLEHTKILSVSEKYAADVVELAKVLGLPKVPERIEGYDISNIFGKQAVGAMVVFSGGEPDKSQYRKFKIKIGQPASAKATAGKGGDVGMLKEVLERRFKRSLTNANGRQVAPTDANGRQITPKVANGRQGTPSWPSPDLIIVDGGKAQLNVAIRVLKNFDLDLPVISVSKGKSLRSAQAPDKIFFPNEKKPLELPLASPALHIIKRVRDEAHRFAIKYHRLLRKKRVLK